MKYVSFDPEAQVVGQAMLGFRAAIRKETIEPVLEKYGLTNIQPEQWYPLQKWLDVLTELDAGAASMLTFVDIGIGVATNVVLPDDALQYVKEKGYVKFMCNVGLSAYQRDHRGNVGQIKAEEVSDHQVKFILNTPYPPDFFYGIGYGFAKRFCSSFVVHYEDLAMREPKPGEPVIIHTVVNP